MIIACEFLTDEKNASSLLIGSLFNQLAMVLCVGLIMGCALDTVGGWYIGEGLGSSIRSTTASSISISSWSMKLRSVLRSPPWTSASRAFILAREERAARDRRKTVSERNTGMRTGNKVYRS